MLSIGWLSELQSASFLESSCPPGQGWCGSRWAQTLTSICSKKIASVMEAIFQRWFPLDRSVKLTTKISHLRVSAHHIREYTPGFMQGRGPQKQRKQARTRGRCNPRDPFPPSSPHLLKAPQPSEYHQKPQASWQVYGFGGDISGSVIV